MAQLNEIERRTFALNIDEIEERGEDKQKVLTGHAAVFDTYTDIGWWEERVLPGAFANSITKDDIRALFNHDPNYIIGRNRAGTLKLKEDSKGLAVEITPPNTQFGRDLVSLIERGDISQMSIGFQAIKQNWNEVEGEKDKRDIVEAKLWDVSPVTYPAFDTTDISVRSYEAWKKQADKVSRMSYYRWKIELERRSI